MLATVFDKAELETFREDYEKVKKKVNAEERRKFFKSAAKKFAEGAAKKAGEGVVAVLKAHIGVV